MKTRYLTFILRLRLDNQPPQDPAEEHISGSVQQVGLQDVFYFDSAEKFQQALQQLAAGLSLKEVKHAKSD
jgi:hypothetical protein